MKKTLKIIGPLFVIGIVTIAAITINETYPYYANRTTKALISKMINSHGGLEKWVNAPSITYTHDMIDPKNPDDHWLSIETHEQGQRRCYQEWTFDNAKLVNDGKNIWTIDWKRANPPSMMAGVSYFFINIVWMTQDEGANLELLDDTKVELIEKGKQFKTVRLTFTGASPFEYFDIYIDPDTYLMRGVKYTVTHKDLFKAFGLPDDTKFMGPLLKVYKEHTNVNGLVMTTRYDTYKPNGQNYGIHKVSNYDFGKPFDEARLKRPDNAVVFK